MTIILVSFIVEGLLFFFLKNLIDVELLSIIMITINSFVLLYVFKRCTKSKTIIILLSVSYILRLALMFFDIYGSEIFLLPHAGIDTIDFHNVGSQVAQGTLSIANIDGEYYSLFVGFIYRVFGINRIISQYINVLFGICLPLVFLKIVNFLKIKEKKVLFPFIIISFFPQFLLLSAILLRESIIIFMIALSVYFFIKWYKEGALLNGILSVIPIFIAMIFHAGTITVLLVYLFAFAFYDREADRFRLTKNVLYIGAGSVLIFVLVLLFFENLFLQKFFFIFDGKFRYFIAIANYRLGDSSYLNGLVCNNYWDVLLYSPSRLVYYLFAPMPWDWRNLMDAVAFLADSVFYLFFIFETIRLYRKHGCKDKKIFFLLILAFYMFSLLYAQATPGAGTAIRHRCNVLFLYLISYVMVMPDRKSGKGKIVKVETK